MSLSSFLNSPDYVYSVSITNSYNPAGSNAQPVAVNDGTSDGKIEVITTATAIDLKTLTLPAGSYNIRMKCAIAPTLVNTTLAYAQLFLLSGNTALTGPALACSSAKSFSNAVVIDTTANAVNGATPTLKGTATAGILQQWVIDETVSLVLTSATTMHLGLSYSGLNNACNIYYGGSPTYNLSQNASLTATKSF
jgi:hypothetical protein